MLYTIVSVVEGTMISLLLQLEGNTITLSYDGDKTWKSTDVLDIDDILDLLMICHGVNGTSWKVTLTIAGASLPFYSKKGKIKKGYSRLIKNISMPKKKDIT